MSISNARTAITTALADVGVWRSVRTFLKRPGVRDLLANFGIYQYYPAVDRRWLERAIIPHYTQRPDIRRVVFIGCDWYTQGYKTFFRNCEYWTVECDPAKRRYGARLHIVGPMERLGEWFGPDSVDLIVCNGVFGFGLNRREDVEEAFAAAYRCLRPGGELLVGWNDMPEKKPFPLEECAALMQFEPLVFPTFGASRYETGSQFRHVFDFLRKPSPEVDAANAA